VEYVVDHRLLAVERYFAIAEIGIGGGSSHRNSSFIDRTIARRIGARYLTLVPIVLSGWYFREMEVGCQSFITD
jgi:hypothetical protein